MLSVNRTQPTRTCVRSDYQMARDPNIWGADCCEFKPSRWLDESGKLRTFPAWTNHVFNAGPRLCLGMNLATFEAVSVMVEIVRNFDLDFAPGWWESVPKTGGICDVGEPEPLYLPSLTLQMKVSCSPIPSRVGLSLSQSPLLVTARRRDAAL